MSISSDMDMLANTINEELVRLMHAGCDGYEDIATEVERAKAVQSLASQMVSARRLVLDTTQFAVRLQSENAASKTATALLEDGGSDGER